MNYSIFDVDGTILDSMEVWNTLASQYVQSLGMVPEKNLDEIIAESGIKAGNLLALLMEMEIKGIVSSVSGGKYRRKK